MTGAEVLDALSKLTPAQLAMSVETEGCDCDGDVEQVRIENGAIYLARHIVSDEYIKALDYTNQPPRGVVI